MIVEDEPDLLRVLSQHLKNHHYQVVEAEDGESGLQKVNDEKPDLIILDIKMPKLDGYSFVKELQSRREFAKIPVIILTAHSNFDKLFKVEGVAAYFTKPYEIKEIVSGIEAALK